jgi:hypothetical protein
MPSTRTPRFEDRDDHRDRMRFRVGSPLSLPHAVEIGKALAFSGVIVNKTPRAHTIVLIKAGIGILNHRFSSDDGSVNFFCSGKHVHRRGKGNLLFISRQLFALKTLAHASRKFFQWHDLPINGNATLQTGTISVGFISLANLQKKI